MRKLAQWIAAHIREHIAGNRVSGNMAGEIRWFFNGPPLDILSEVFEQLVGQGRSGIEGLPVLLQVPQLGSGESNPALGACGRCDESHLLNLRNSPRFPSFLALRPPDLYAIRSVSSTTEQFGVAAANHGANTSFDDWLADPFVQRLIDAAIDATATRFPGEARELLLHSLRAIDDVDQEKATRKGAWYLLSRVFEVSSEDSDVEWQISLACGVPPIAENKLSARDQVGILKGIAEALSTGFSSGLEEARARATTEQQVWIDEFITHVRARCDVVTALERAPQAYYAPSLEATLPNPPDWWRGLTVDVWSELLADEPESLGDIEIECLGGVPELQYMKGSPAVVEGAVELLVRVNGNDGQPLDVVLERSAQKNKDGFPRRFRIDGEEVCIDSDPPEHRSPIRYKVSAEGCRPASAKVISLASWSPGIFVGCQYAQQVTPPRAPSRKNRGGANWETSISLPGPGRFELLVYLRPGVRIGATVSGFANSEYASAEETDTLAVRSVRAGVYQIEVEVDSSYQIDIPFERPDKNGSLLHETCRVFLLCEDVAEDGCRSEFERLIRLNRRSIDPRRNKPVIIPDRSGRVSNLQAWMLLENQVVWSYLPVVLAEDYDEFWVQPDWREENGRILSGGKFLVDPRPPASSFVPPADFVEARKELATLITGADEQLGLVEAAPLGEWLRTNQAFQAAIERYIDSYICWLRASPEVATWVDVIAITSLEQDRRTLSRVPDAILLSPLHPLRLAWHSLAQRVLYDAAIGECPCPAAGVIDPRFVPDVLQLPVVSPEGIQYIPFVAVENNSDYWSVLWNGDRLRDLGRRALQRPFGATLGISVGGISTGFSAHQVRRALDDVSNVLCAKPLISVVIDSAGGATDSCNEGVITWSEAQYVEPERSGKLQSPGPRRLDVYDSRDKVSQPDDATIGNLSEDTRHNVRWFSKVPDSIGLDLGIIAQLDSSETEISDAGLRSPIGPGALLRARIRKQLANFFLCESRQARSRIASGDNLADKVVDCVLLLESSADRNLGLRFAPNIYAISEMLEGRRTNLVAISSSTVDPACFLGGWFEDSYLWDYDLPSYSQRAGDTNGYYVLSKVKLSDCERIRKVLAKLPGCEGLSDSEIRNILLEIARRGIPTIRGLSGDDAGSTGDLGLFVASRLLQDRFRITNGQESLLPVLSGNGDAKEIALIVPVDPFRGYLEDITRALTPSEADLTMSRPDLLVVAIRLAGDHAIIRLTPIEVKARLGSILPTREAGEALSQAQTLAKLLGRLSSEKDPLSLWRIAYQHLLLTIICFGMRVYSQHRDLGGRFGEWATFHESIAAAILNDPNAVSIDARGRLIILDNSPESQAVDHDNDGFEETIVISLEDAGRIVAGDAEMFYATVKKRVRDWQLMPAPAQASGEKRLSTAENGPAATKSSLDTENQTGEHTHVPASKGICLKIGSSERSFEAKEYSLGISDTRLNQLNMGVVGDLGTGKTQLLKSLVYQIASSANDNRGIRPRVLIFDYKRDYSSEDFVKATNAQVVRPHKLPLNLFDITNLTDTTVPWLGRFRFFADVLDKIYAGIGPVQRDKLKRAVKAAYDAASGQYPPTIYDVHAVYRDLLDGKSDSPMAIIDDLVDMEIFEPDPSKIIPFDQFLEGVVVISLDALGQDDRSKNMLVAVMLNMFYENMLRLPKRPFVGTNPQLRVIDSYLLVDEADNIMRYEFDVLRKLLLQGREFGCGVILASQYLRHFKVNATDYREPLLTWFVHKVPNITPAELAALGLSSSATEMAERVKTLPNHYCLFKSFDAPGLIIKGLPFYELLAREAEK